MDSTVSEDSDIQTFKVDPSHSQVNFAVSHMGFSKVRGAFESFSGSVAVDPDNLETLEAEASIEVESINTGEEERDQHLRSDDFFNVEEHPELKFSSLKVKEVSDDSFTLAGELTIRGTTNPIELDATYLGEATDPWGNERVGFEAEGTINREDFGLTWNQVLETGGVLVGKTVNISLEVQAVAADDE